MLKGGDEAQLIAAIHDGPFEAPLWSTFLCRLRRAAKADYATLTFRPPGKSLKEAVHLYSGEAREEDVERSRHKYTDPMEPRFQTNLVEGRPYSLTELVSMDESSGTGLHREMYRELVDVNGIHAIRHMRVEEASGVDALLTIARRGEDFTAAEASILQLITPAFRSVLRLYVALERERYAASLTAEAVRRLQFGWLILDRAGHVLGCDEQGELVLSNSGVLSRGPTGRLAAKPAELEREILQALRRVADNPQGRPRAITLTNEPWLDMLLVPARRRSISATATPAAIAYVHGDSWRSADRCEQLADLFGLSAGEARLALALCRGMTIAEAASDFGLKTETVRGYSKNIYAKTGARGLPDLVRIVMRSVLAIAPDA